MEPGVDPIDRLAKHLPADALRLVDRATRWAEAHGVGLYLVGGVVRDLLLGQPNLDIDLVVEGDGIALARAVAGKLRVTSHAAFGTATVKGPGFSLDVATARKETYARPGALPEVEPGSIGDDLFRRDFTINAMALRLSGPRSGELLDPFAGRADLEAGLVRVLHDQSFSDDATRMLRAIRYEQRLGFSLDEGTESLLRRDLAKLETISGDRLRHEFDRIMAEPYAERALRRAGELGILAQVHPSLKRNGRLADALRRARDSRYDASALVFYALFLYRLGPREAEQVLARLQAPKRLAMVVRDTLSLKSQLERGAVADLRPSETYALLRGYVVQAVQANHAAWPGAREHRSLELYLDRLRLVRPLLRGDDLVELGVQPSPRVGEILSALHRAKLDGEVSSRADEVRLVKRLLGSRPGPKRARARRQARTE